MSKHNQNPTTAAQATVSYLSMSGEHIGYAALFQGIADLVQALDAIRDMAHEAGQAQIGGAIGLLAVQLMHLTPDYEALPPLEEKN